MINDGTVQGGYVINDIDGKVQEGYEDFGFSLPTQIYVSLNVIDHHDYPRHL